MEVIEASSGARGGEGPSPPPSSRQSTAAHGASLRALRGRVCPRCRDVLDESAPRSGRKAGAIERCPADGLAYVPAQSLADADGDPFLGATIADRYVVVGKLGSGSMGTVYRARHEPMARDVALKILRLDRALDVHSKARFTREARAMSLLASPYTVAVFDFGEVPPNGEDLVDEGSLYLAMELLEGESLGARLKRLGRVPREEAIRVARHALTSLAEAHEKGIIHRDLKPDNFFLAKVDGASKEICKVLDFGIAKIMGEPEGIDAAETQAGTVFGTPRYMSPEQAQGKTPDARGDLYSLGVVLYHMLAGKPPFTDGDAVVVMAHHIKSTPKPLAEVAPDARIEPALDAIVMRALAKDPADRWPSAKAFLDALAALDDKTMTSVPPPKMPHAVEGAFVSSPSLIEPKPPSKRRLGATITTGAAALAALIAIVTLRPPRDPVPLARASVALVAAARRLAVLKAEAALRDAANAPAPASAEPSPSASPPPFAAPPPTAPRQPPKRSVYKRFE